MFPNSVKVIHNTEEIEALCQSCGACCATFRVSFYWAESTAHPFGSVPEEMTEKLNHSRSCMKGTSSSTPRCCALEGSIGESVSCNIYHLRSSTCREYDVFSSDGTLNPRCNPARAKHGLPELNVRYVPIIPIEGPVKPLEH